MYDLCPDIEPSIESSDGGSSNKVRKYQYNPEDQEHEEAILVTRRNPRRIKWGDQRALRHLKIENESSKDKIFFINHIAAGSKQAKWYLVQLDMDQLYLVDMRKYGVYCCQWYNRQYEDCKKYPTTECRFWPEIITKNQDGILVKILPVIPSKVHNLLQNNKKYVWYQYDISLAEHMLVGPFQFGTIGRNKLKYPNMIDDKQWKELDKERRKKGTNTSDTKEVVTL